MPRSPRSGSKDGASRSVLGQLRSSDLRGSARLAIQATAGVTRIVEGVHQSVLGSMGLPGGTEPGRSRGLTGMVYQGIHGVTRLVDRGLQTALLRIEPLLDRVMAEQDAAAPSAEREAVLAALNGVMGDRLLADGNPLALGMALRQDGRPLDLQALHSRNAVSGKLLLLVHGLCMNDLQWQHAGHDHGVHLAQALGYTPVHVRYNTGLHTSVNGRELAGHIEALLAAWPVPLQEFAVLAHSMGGLVIRAACHYGTEAGHAWPRQLQRIVFLGTPHHGAPLERAGHQVDVLLGRTPFSRPFARLAQLRSAGITDLRFGHVLDTDWQGHDRFRQLRDQRLPLPLPAGVECFAVAATLAARRSRVADRLVGDGLVPLHSALGVHDDPARQLAFPPTHRHSAFRTGHLDLLSDAGVARQLVQWLEKPPIPRPVD
ncbi:triacylglycerol lipase [uncultured Hydrogenophaga sp.]|uniref:esterase/lipase family protein n=1 Tax=uncultured Hydrogenophaga sp. TaxID=199683 RepID=UPI00265E3B09|nr:alpha/beta hydrolase [uncultured Hydrogenophaga sp.]